MIKVEESNLYREIHEQPKHVEHCLRLNEEMMEKIASEVKRRDIKQVVLVGRGSSDHANLVGKYAFEIYTDMIASIATPSVTTYYDGNVDYSNALVIGISQCGEAQDVFEVLSKCHNQGGIAVSITNVRDCLMSSFEYYMNLECGEEKSFTACKSYLTQMTILLGLVAKISGSKALSSQLKKAPEVIEKCFEIEKQIYQILPMYRNANQVYLFARGLLYALANETELKIIEASYLDARCYASSDFYHGPISMTPRFMPNIFFIADSTTNETTIELHNKLKDEKNLYTMIVTNDEKISKLANHSVLLPEECDGILGVYGCAVFSQLFACLLAIERGYNPDFPEGLSKVTVTR